MMEQRLIAEILKRKNAMNKMTSRQRVVTALQHQEPDRVPLGIWMTLDAYKKLRRHLGLEVKDKYPVDLPPGRRT